MWPFPIYQLATEVLSLSLSKERYIIFANTSSVLEKKIIELLMNIIFIYFQVVNLLLDLAGVDNMVSGIHARLHSTTEDNVTLLATQYRVWITRL